MGAPPPGGWSQWAANGGANATGPGQKNDPRRYLAPPQSSVSLSDMIKKATGSVGTVAGAVGATAPPSPQDRLDAIKAPTALTLEDPTKAYTQKDFAGPLPEYADMRTQLQSTFARNKSSAQDALARRLAALGNLNSGAGIKQSENLDNELARSEAEANTGLNAQEAQTRRGLQQNEEAKGFQASQTALGRNFAREQYNAGIPFQFGQFQFDSQSKLAALDLQKQQFGLSKDAFDWQKQIDEYNKKLGAYQAGHSGGLFGGGGFLGTGIGAGSADIEG